MVSLCGVPLWWVSFLLLLPLLSFLKKKNIWGGGRNDQKLQLPPGPPQLPIIGNLHQLGGLLHRTLRQLSNKYGPVMLLRLGNLPTVLISSADAAREVLRVHDLHCCNRPPLTGAGRLSYNCLDIAFTPYSDYWREIRKVSVQELFSLKRVDSFQSIREEEVAAFINSLSMYAASATPVDLSRAFYKVSAEITLRIAFGTTFGATDFDKDRFKEVVNDAEALLGSFCASDYFPFVGWIVDMLNGFHAQTERVFHELDAFYQKTIEDHLGAYRSDGVEDIVDVLLRIEREQLGFGNTWLTKDHIKAVLMNIFLAGVDTSSITLIWAMAELVKNPRVMKKAQNEVRNYVRNKEMIAEGDLQMLQYLKMVIKETLRFRPASLMLIPREAMSHFKINGYDICVGNSAAEEFGSNKK